MSIFDAIQIRFSTENKEKGKHVTRTANKYAHNMAVVNNCEYDKSKTVDGYNKT